MLYCTQFANSIENVNKDFFKPFTVRTVKDSKNVSKDFGPICEFLLETIFFIANFVTLRRQGTVIATVCKKDKQTVKFIEIRRDFSGNENIF